MNIIKLKDELEVHFKDFKIHPKLVNEISQTLEKTGERKAFLSKFINNLNFLKSYGELAHIQSTDKFEKLKNAENMYSMHIKGKTFNVRVLYSFLSNGTILLHGFDEKSGKKVTDYSKAIPIAEKRLDEYNNLRR